MGGEAREWAVEFDVREDASCVFLSAERLRDAVAGDHVVVTSTRPAAVRRGRLVELLDDPGARPLLRRLDRGRFRAQPALSSTSA